MNSIKARIAKLEGSQRPAESTGLISVLKELKQQKGDLSPIPEGLTVAEALTQVIFLLPD